MAPPPEQNGEENEGGDDVIGAPMKKTQTKRSRWATRKMTVKSSSLKRLSILNRNGRKRSSGGEKKGLANGTQAAGLGGADPETETASEGAHAEPRQLYFNEPLPPELLDEEGHPVQHFTRNKIRTAKYTAISFIPKNLWFQFQNVANIFFLFTDILVIFPIFGGVNPGLNAVPLIFILTVTAIKDAIEDYRRTILDKELNNAPVHRLCGWDNPNVQADNVSLWRRIKKATSRFFASIWHLIKGLWKKEDEATRRRRSGIYDDPRPSTETRATQRQSMASQRQSFVSAREDIQMSPLPSPMHAGEHHLAPPDPSKDRPTSSYSFQGSESNFMAIKGDIINHDAPAPGKARFRKDAWKNLQVGDFVRLYGDDELPADIVILSTSDPDGACYVETKNLDGETNLKVRQALRCGRGLKHARDCERAQFMIDSEPPQPNLYKYNGAIKWDQQVSDTTKKSMSEPITIDNMLLRGCNLRNTEWVLGVVIFTGHDTKIMMNSGATPSKRPRIAKELNYNVVWNFIILFVMCLITAVVNGVLWAKSDASSAFFDYGPQGSTPQMGGFITFWAAIIVFQNLVPISLYISLEIVRTLQAFFIYSDVGMYYAEIDQPCVPKSWNISDDLGQIEYIFSDKTGTLTQNVMEFKKATINGQPYGEAFTEAQAGMQKRDGNADFEQQTAKIRADIADAKVRALEDLRRLYPNPYLHDEDLTFIAPDFVDDLAGKHGEEQKKANENFMLTLALCHTVITEKKPGDDTRIIFKAQSPDEAALVATARDMGFTVLGHTGDGINVNVLGEDRHYTILNTIEFNSSRKRMSAIVKMPDGQIRLLCKGADSVIYSRLKRGQQQQLRRETAEHLELFAREGLRTLCIAERVLTQDEYTSWRKEHDAAATALEEREEKLEAAADLIEQDLTLLGGTAIEDRLQDGVPDTIELLADGGIKLWVLTGDKVETAINIGFSCNLLNNDMELIRLQVHEDESGETPPETYFAELSNTLDQHLQTFGITGSDADLQAAKKEHHAPAATHALVIDGFTLRWVLDDALRQKFLLLCKNCKSVLCCRVSPAQKAAVVAMVKNSLDVMTLAVGDGANDVAMIQEADVGVGIAGVEGRQAVMSSDYAIGQFRFLQRLVLVHGRWSYRRLAETISNFFYKNILWVFSILWFECFANFDVTYIFEYTYIIMFNLLFTSVPVILMGVLDQDVSDAVSLAVPQLYRRGIERLEWTQTKFWLYMLDGLYQSVMVFFVPYLAFIMNTFITENGLDLFERYRLGAYMAHPAVLTINLYILINCYRWDWLILLVVVISDLFIFFWTGVWTSGSYSATFSGAAAQCYGELSFWAVFILTPVMCIFPRYAIKALQKVYYPYDIDIIREQVSLGQFKYLDHADPTATVHPHHGGDSNEEHGVATASTGSSETDHKPLPQHPTRSSSRRQPQHGHFGSVDEDRKPIYPPSENRTHHTRTQTGSDGTSYTNNGSAHAHSQSLEMPMRQSIDRPRPSYDRVRSSMDRVRPSFEASHDFTSANFLARIESSHSARRSRLSHVVSDQGDGVGDLGVGGSGQGGPTTPRHSNLRSRLRGLSVMSSKSKS